MAWQTVSSNENESLDDSVLAAKTKKKKKHNENITETREIYKENIL